MEFIKKHKYTIILVVVILIVVGYMGMKWYEEKMKLVERGWADSKFPYHEYTLLEMMRIKPGGDLNDEMRAEFEKQLKNLPTRTTPQETFDKYIQALKDGDIEGALECFLEGEQEQGRMRNILYNDKKEGKLEEIARMTEEIKLQIPWNKEKIEKNSTGEIGAYYSFTCIYDESTTCNIGFSKDLYGDWKISDL